ncbi:Uncharacterized membrane protein [Actinopolyspora alba]|uniref:Uncharacterized membrane protein n=1 Tax=Actinopolyspora alba TaxID=673379 RepID=A0A1I1TEU0_9ACTN|nr:hypothetical protein [Actinopolyspora alba]SFD57105.1 Uncharacterized membrane protein [Actinopolyspora alba]
MKRPSSATVLAGSLTLTGALHFLLPRPFDSIVPRRLPGSPRGWTYLSGAAELGCAAAVAHPRTRRAGASATTALFAAVFPANVKMALDYRNRSIPLRFVAYARLPLQLPLIQWALRVRRNTGR